MAGWVEEGVIMGVIGIGGLFFCVCDFKVLGVWYVEYFGVGDGEWGLWNQEVGMMVFLLFKDDIDYFFVDCQWMLNLCVNGIDVLLEKLWVVGVEVIIKFEWDFFEIGCFVCIYDFEGNFIELWEFVFDG